MRGQAVAIVGASSQRHKFGNKAVRAYRRQGWEVFPVNPHGGEVEGLPVFRSLREIPHPVRRVALYVPPDVGITLLPEIAGLGEVELFVNPGAESPALLDRAAELGLSPTLACAIVDIGERPSHFSDA